MQHICRRASISLAFGSVLLCSTLLFACSASDSVPDESASDASSDSAKTDSQVDSGKSDSAIEASDDAADSSDSATTPDSQPDVIDTDTSTAGSLTSHTYSGPNGARDYLLYTPPGYSASKPLPLLVALHGCTQTGSDFSSGTRFNALAAEQGFMVVYPEQPYTANVSKCWNWSMYFNRGAGEPAILAGIVEEVSTKWSVDPKRVFATGLSAGGAMALVLGAAYPDVFAAVGTAEGCPYQGLPCFSMASTATGDSLAKLVVAQMDTRARLVPLFVVQGEADTYVPKANAELIIKEWIGAADLIDDSLANGSIPSSPKTTESLSVAGGYSYQAKKYAGPSSSTFLEYWLVATLAHAWSGGSSTGGTYFDPKGPDASKGTWDFFAAHPMP